MPIITRRRMGGGWARVAPPAGFTWTPPVQVYESGGQFRAVPDLSAFEYVGAGKTYFVDPVGGNNAWPGTAAQPLQFIYTAFAKADVDIVLAKPGVYDRTNGWAGLTSTRSVTLKPWGAGRVVITAHHPGLAWTIDDSATYYTTRSAVLRVLDVSLTDGNGDYSELALQANLAAVKANAGSWWLDGTTLWVHTADGRAPDVDIWPILNQTNGLANGNFITYVENVDFIGGTNAMRVTSSAEGQTPVAYFKNCSFQFASSGLAGISARGAAVYLQGCMAKANSGDGFSYEVANTIIPKGVEISCLGRDNGTADGVDNDNGSAMHSGGAVVRVKGLYYRNRGPNVADLDSLSWNLGCTAHTSTATVGAQPTNWMAANGLANAAMWLDRCLAYGTLYDLYTTSAGDALKYRNCGPFVLGGAGTMGPY